jgi:hypothetical protein
MGESGSPSIATLKEPDLTEVGGLYLNRIASIFAKFGYSCQVSSKIRGISGNLHQFDFVCTRAENGEKIIVSSLLSFCGNRDAMEIELVKLRLKTYDCSPDLCMVVVVDPTNETREMAAQYKLRLIEIGRGEEPYDSIELVLLRREEDESKPFNSFAKVKN